MRMTHAPANNNCTRECMTLLPPQDKDKPRILLVEDYAANILVATTYLENMGYAYDLAANGEEAIEKAGNGAYVAILMDVQLQGIDGFEATRLIRKHEKQTLKPRTAIIGMTAHALSGDRERCLSAGMDDYIPKPFHPDILMSKLSAACAAAQKAA